MPIMTKAKVPFIFYTRLHLTELTGLKVSNIPQLLRLLKEVPGACIYHHTHRFLQQHQYLSPEPPNDFAYWVTEILGENELGERLASIDTMRFKTIRDLRENIIMTMEDYLKDYPSEHLKQCHKNEEFYFMKSISFIIPTHHTASDLAEFLDILDKITIDSIYFHIFEARLRLEKGTNDFSNWIANSIGDEALARDIERIDPYTRTLDSLRKTLIAAIKRRMPLKKDGNV